MDNNYKRTFSQIRPSDEAIERIFEMREKKTKRINFKALIAVAACLTALLCGTLTANAATNGALFEGIQLVVNGEDVDLKDYIKNYNSYVDENGNTVSEFELEVPDENGEASITVNEKFVSEIDINATTDSENNPIISYEITE